MGVLEGIRVAEHVARDTARIVAGSNDANQRQTVQPRARHTGTVAVRQPQAVVIPPREPIDGDALLNDVHTALERFAVWPKEAALVTACLYAAHAHGKDAKTGLPCWPYSPKLFFTSAEGNSGKSWMGRLTGKFCPDDKMMVEINKANLIRLIEERATPIVTELDVLVNTGARNRWFTGIANASYEADQATSRTQNGKRVDIPLQCPMILDGLESVIKGTGTDLKTLVSRCIIIHVERAPEGYRPPRFDKAARAVFQFGSVKLGEWLAQLVNFGIEVNDGEYVPIGDYVPDVPPWLGNRAAALWEPLFAVADAAGGDWPAWARMACADLEHGGDSWAPPADEENDDAAESAYQDTLAAWRTGNAPATPDDEAGDDEA